MKKYEQKSLQLSKLIGNTPLLEINYSINYKLKKIYAKAEWFNLTGSIKDRFALYSIIEAYKNGELKENQTIVEATSGNTGISFSCIGKYFGHDIVIFMPDYMSEERKKLLKSYGAKLILVSKEQGGFLECIRLAKEYAKTHNAYCPLQFENKANTYSHMLTTAKEIFRQCSNINAFVCGVGTGGTLMGVAEYFKNINKDVDIYALEPQNSPTLSTGYKTGSHKIQGISDEFVPKLFEYNNIKKTIKISDDDAIEISKKLCSEIGLGVGISSGANVMASILINEEENYENIVTVLTDDNKKYISTDLHKTDNYKLKDDIKFLDYKVIL